VIYLTKNNEKQRDMHRVACCVTAMAQHFFFFFLNYQIAKRYELRQETFDAMSTGGAE
jgi:hypothetical protein